MKRKTKAITRLLTVAGCVVIFAASGFAQSTTGTVTISATVSKFVEINSGGAVTLNGNSGGGITTDGVANNPLAVSINLGELGPSNTNNFVSASVPLKLRSNANYVLSMSATVASTGTTTNRIGAADVGFGLTTITRAGTGVHLAGTDTNATSGDPTLPANGSVNATTGRYEFTAVKSSLNSFTTASTALSGPFILNAVPRSNNNGLSTLAIFAVKPQFFENGTTNISVTFTIAAP
jgi:hypothetical protein